MRNIAKEERFSESRAFFFLLSIINKNQENCSTYLLKMSKANGKRVVET